jgi:hypothetical protein
MKKVMPIVAMNRMMPSWLTSLRSTIRSAAQAMTAMTAAANRKAATRARPNGQCHSACMTSRARTSASAAVSTIAPWAKLNTPEALKISTKPSATSE